jgi:hypothetical protein
MRVYVAKLKMELDRVQLDFVDENSAQNVTMGAAARNPLVNGAGEAVATAVIGVVQAEDDHHVNDNDDDGVDGSVGL